MTSQEPITDQEPAGEPPAPPVSAVTGTPGEESPGEDLGAPRLRWWLEIIYIAAFYGLYTLVRNTFGSNGSSVNGIVSPLAVQHAYGHAVDIINIEKSLGLWIEPRLQQWYLGLPFHGFIRFWNVYYGSFHFVVTIGALIWLFFRRPNRYPLWRNALAVTTALALVGFASFSLMPPRLLDFTGIYGAANPAYGILAKPHYGLIDTLQVYGGLWSFGSGTMAQLSNQYAAMPSLHIGWSTWCAFALYPMVKRWWAKTLVVLYPCATLFCIIVTANHYWLDAAVGLINLGIGIGVGWLLAQGMRRLRRAWRLRRRAALAVK